MFGRLIKKSPFDIEDDSPRIISIDRIAYLQLILWMMFCIIIVRLVIVCFFPKTIVKKSALSHSGKIVRENPRGSIYDRAQNLLAYSVYTPSLFCSPADILYPDEMAEMVSKKLGLDYELVRQKMIQTDKAGNKLRYVLIQRAVENLSKAELEDFISKLNKWHDKKYKESQKKDENKLTLWQEILFYLRDKPDEDPIMQKRGKPLFIKYEWLRQYPHQDVGGNIIGFVARNDSKDGGRIAGMDGIERDWDRYLYADPTEITGRKTGNGFILPSTSQEQQGQCPGANLELTIDLEIQHVLEKELDKRIIECNASDGMGIIMNPYTGAILAMASRPSYDPNLPETRQGDALKNKVLYELIEPGSTFKVITASAGLEKGGFTKDTIINCEGGSYRVGNKVIRDVHGMGAVPFWKCFEQSSNVGFVKVGQKVGLDTLREYVKKFGFGTKALSDISTERIGAISTNRAETTLSSMSIGYAVNVTPIQLARAYAVIANGGYLVEPYLVEKAVLPSGEVIYEHKAESFTRVIQPETAETIRTLCHQVVLKGTGKSANIPQYKVGGKTGTAHTARPRSEGGGYDPNKIISVFSGFAPVTNPKIVAVIVIRYPMSKIKYGGYVCGPVFKNVVYYTLTRLKVPPDPVPLELLKQDGFIAENSVEKDNDALYFESIEPQWINEILTDEPSMPVNEKATDSLFADTGKKSPNKKAEEKVKPSIPVNPLSEEELIKMAKESETLPNLLGLTKHQALNVLTALKIEYECNGYGRVISQIPFPGAPLENVDVCQLNFSGVVEDEMKKTSVTAKE
ncbi:MAG TPA: penicillin-binding transpeptidase domain-containing protein [Candidatus Hydrogenedens sp.]|nr:hypothetical protein [Candidatus Hydrogenedens sp.]HPP58480.1 penicillin-binding transpeptidase domain-containing protein [Candidatus Hydrogenedens sp.]